MICKQCSKTLFRDDDNLCAACGAIQNNPSSKMLEGHYYHDYWSGCSSLCASVLTGSVWMEFSTGQRHSYTIKSALERFIHLKDCCSCDAADEPKKLCHYCFLPILDKGVVEIIYENRRQIERVFCCKQHAAFYQMGAEG